MRYRATCPCRASRVEQALLVPCCVLRGAPTCWPGAEPFDGTHAKLRYPPARLPAPCVALTPARRSAARWHSAASSSCSCPASAPRRCWCRRWRQTTAAAWTCSLTPAKRQRPGRCAGKALQAKQAPLWGRLPCSGTMLLCAALHAACLLPKRAATLATSRPEHR